MKRIVYLLALLSALGPVRAEPRNPLDALRLGDLTATRERPLFRPTRRPPQEAPVVAPAAEPPPVEERPVALEPPPFELIGAVVGGNTAIALLRNKTNGQVVRLRTGESAEGWRVKIVETRTVALELDGRTQSLALAAPSASPASAEVTGDSEPPETNAPPPASDLKRVAARMRPDR